MYIHIVNRFYIDIAGRLRYFEIKFLLCCFIRWKLHDIYIFDLFNDFVKINIVRINCFIVIYKQTGYLLNSVI